MLTSAYFLLEAICYCLHVCGVLVTLHCTYISTFMATTANKWYIVIGTFGLFINLSPEAICCCLQTCYNVCLWCVVDMPCIHNRTKLFKNKIS